MRITQYNVTKRCIQDVMCFGVLQYEPELFPGLIYRVKSPKVVVLCFVSGKVVLTGRPQTYTRAMPSNLAGHASSQALVLLMQDFLRALQLLTSVFVQQGRCGT